MPNIKSAEKRVKTARLKTALNAAGKSALRTKIKKAKEAISNKSATASVQFVEAIKSIDKAASKNLMHKNTAARRKSKLSKALKATQVL